jgi:hypothetical protein
MAFGVLITNGTGTLTGASIGASNAISINGGTGVAVNDGDFIFVAVGEQTALTASACTDNLGNTYTSPTGTLATTISGKVFYSVSRKRGTLTTVTVTATSSANDFAMCAAIFGGGYDIPPANSSPANISNDITTPYTCPTTGTLTQAINLVIGWAAHNAGAVNWTGSAVTVQIQANRLNAAAVIASVVTAVTTAVVPAFTGTAPTNDVLGTFSFGANDLRPQAAL